VVDGPDTRQFVGIVALKDLLTARTRILEAEERRERIYALPRLIKAWGLR
jgi:hypothetical protein